MNWSCLNHIKDYVPLEDGGAFVCATSKLFSEQPPGSSESLTLTSWRLRDLRPTDWEPMSTSI